MQAVPPELLHVLSGKLWHATSHERIAPILQEGIVATAPPEWQSGRSRQLGGVSLMDFRSHSEADLAQSLASGHCHWSPWLTGDQGGRRCSVWLELDLNELPGELLDPERFLQLHREATSAGDFRHHIIRGFEACHIGEIPPRALRHAVMVYKLDASVWRRVQRLDELPRELGTFLPLCTDEFVDPRGPAPRELLLQKMGANPTDSGGEIGRVLAEARKRLLRD